MFALWLARLQASVARSPRRPRHRVPRVLFPPRRRPFLESLEERLPPNNLLALGVGAGSEGVAVVATSENSASDRGATAESARNYEPSILIRIDELESRPTTAISENAARDPLSAAFNGDTFPTDSAAGEAAASGDLGESPVGAHAASLVSAASPAADGAARPAALLAAGNTASPVALSASAAAADVVGLAIQSFLAAQATEAVALSAQHPGQGGAVQSNQASYEPDAVGRLSAYGQIPLSFEANVGQTDARVDFLSRGSGYSLFLTPTEAVMSLQQQPAGGQQAAEDVLRMQLVGANANPPVVGLDQQAGVSNYFIGNDPGQWHANVANYGKVEYQNVYAGIDMVYYGNQQQLEYDFHVAPALIPPQSVFASPARRINISTPAETWSCTRLAAT